MDRYRVVKQNNEFRLYDNRIGAIVPRSQAYPCKTQKAADKKARQYNDRDRLTDSVIGSAAVEPLGQRTLRLLRIHNGH